MSKPATVVAITAYEEDAKIGSINLCEIVKLDLESYMENELKGREDVTTSEVMNEMAKWCEHWARIFGTGVVIAESAEQHAEQKD